MFAPATNATGNDYASFGFEVVDTGSTANGGQNTSSAATATINVAAVNQAPTTSSFSLHVSENQSLPLTSSLFPFTDTNIPAEPLAGIVLTSLAGAGNADAQYGGRRRADQPADHQGRARRGGSGIHPGVGRDRLQLCVIWVRSGRLGFDRERRPEHLFRGDRSPSTSGTVNQPPVTGNAAITAYENVPFAFVTSDFPYSDPNNSSPTALKAVIVVALPTTGVLTDDGVAVTAGQAISAADIASGDLVYTPAPMRSERPRPVSRSKSKTAGERRVAASTRRLRRRSR